MKKTKTSSFGTPKRESHDSSDFYNRSLFGNGLLRKFPKELSVKELREIKISEIGDWADKIYCQSSENMSMIPDNSIALAFTSPPYNVGKDYDDDIDLDSYLELIQNVAREVYRVLRPGGRYLVNIANLGRKPYIPLHAFFYDIHINAGFIPMGEIIWQKSDGASGNCAWGSWQSAKAPSLRDIHEYILVFSKQSFFRPDKGESSISATEFMDATLSVWRIPPESAKRVRHPAPYPVELAERVIELYSYKGDVVLDPFMGSGTTCVAAKNKNRHFVGFDVSEEYCQIARDRIEMKGKLYMPSEKTETSELSVAFGILGIKNPLTLSDDDVIRSFEKTLPIDKYIRFKKEFTNPTNSNIYKKLVDLGIELKNHYPLFDVVSSLRWYGPDKQAKTYSGAQDLLVANIPVSVKAGSNIVGNWSPNNIFENIPQGKVLGDKSENWYLVADKAGLQKLYDVVRNVRLYQYPEFPSSIEDFENNAKQRNRKELQSEIKKLSDDKQKEFDESYYSLAQNVSTYSAKVFNDNFSAAMQTPSRNAIIEHIIKYLFRLDSVEYLLTGIEGQSVFGVKIPSITQWKKEWEVLKIFAKPDLKRKQSRVIIVVNYRNKIQKTTHSAQFHVEIRWSHGKFCGAPEGKLYKDFKWSEIAFVQTIV